MILQGEMEGITFLRALPPLNKYVLLGPVRADGRWMSADRSIGDHAAGQAAR